MSKGKRVSKRDVKPVMTAQIAYVDILDTNGNVIKRAELEPDERDYTGLVQIAHEETELDEFHLIPMLRRQQRLERQIFQETQKIRGKKVTPINNPRSW